MSGSGTRAGTRSDRLGTWALVSFLVVILPVFGLNVFLSAGLEMVGFFAGLICLLCTFGAVVCGFIGLVSTEYEERRNARHGLLKAAPPALIGGFYAVVLFLFLTSDQPLFG